MERAAVFRLRGEMMIRGGRRFRCGARRLPSVSGRGAVVVAERYAVSDSAQGAFLLAGCCPVGPGLRSPERPSAGIVARNGRVVLRGPIDQAVEDRDQAPAELRERVFHPGRHLRVQLPAGAAGPNGKAACDAVRSSWFCVGGRRLGGPYCGTKNDAPHTDASLGGNPVNRNV